MTKPQTTPIKKLDPVTVMEIVEIIRSRSKYMTRAGRAIASKELRELADYLENKL
jgi:hypothetical protein